MIYNRTGRYDRAVAEAQEARRSPGPSISAVEPAFAFRALGRDVDARRTAEEAVQLGVETTPTRRLLYQLGFAAGDGSAAAHLAWAKSKPREFDLVSAEAQAAAFEGRLREAAGLYQRAIDIALARELSGTAPGYAAHLRPRLFYRDPHAPADHIKRVIAGSDADTESPGTVPRFRAAAALDWRAWSRRRNHSSAMPTAVIRTSTFVHTVCVADDARGCRAFKGRVAEAITALRNATPTELGTVAGLVPFYLRGEAHLMKREYSEAIRQYESILQHRGVDPLSPVVPLAHLGIARAQARSGDRDAARRAYEALFDLEVGGRGLPLVAARAEYAALK